MDGYLFANGFVNISKDCKAINSHTVFISLW